MDERVMRLRIGIVVVIGVIITIVLVMVFAAGPSVFQGNYVVHVGFPEAPGIAVDTPVRKSGVLIGRVSDVKLLDKGGVQVSLRIRDKYRLRENETCRIGSGSILGDAVIEFVPYEPDELVARFDRNGNKRLDPDEQERATQLVGDDAYLGDGIVASNPLRVLVNVERNVQGALASVQGAGNEVGELARTFNQTVGGNKPQLQQIMAKTERALDSFEETMTAMQKMLGDKELVARLHESLKGVPDFLDETRQTMTVARETMVKFQQVSQKAENNLDNIESFTKPLRERGAELLDNVERGTENLNELLTQLVTFSKALNSSEGTLGRLVHEDGVYQKVDRLVGNIEELSQRLRPIVEDVRIFTDKIARDPRQLGVQGAIDRRPTGLKTGVEWK